MLHEYWRTFMYAYRLRIAALAAVAAAGLAACTTPYGYSGVSVGLGNGYYGSNYGYGYGYPGYAYGYGAGYPGYGLGYAPYWGWQDDFYYPGTGYYVYDVYRRPHRWTDAQRRYWTERRDRAVSTTTTRQPVVIRENWKDFSRNRTVTRSTRVDRYDDQITRVQRSNRPAKIEHSVRPEHVERSVARSDQASKAAVREERRADVRQSTVGEEQAIRSNGRHRGSSKDD